MHFVVRCLQRYHAGHKWLEGVNLVAMEVIVSQDIGS